MADLSGNNFTADDRTALARVERYIDQYANNAAMLLKDGMSLRGYVAASLSEVGGADMNDTLAAALDKLQSRFGTPMNFGNPLAFGLEA